MLLLMLSESTIPLTHEATPFARELTPEVPTSPKSAKSCTQQAGVPSTALADDATERSSASFFGPHQPIPKHTLRGGIVAECIAAGLCAGTLSEQERGMT